jgi:ankyrin repeat protein
MMLSGGHHMHRVLLLVGVGLSLIAVGGCESPRPALTLAARAGDLEAIKTLLDGGIDVNGPDSEEGWAPLFHAVHMRQAAAVVLLLERGADPNKRFDRLVPLEVAAAQRDPAILEILLAHGADIRARGPDGSTALSVAVSGGAMTDGDLPFLGGCHPATVRALLAHDPSQRLPDTFAGRRALWFAKAHGCTEVIEMVKG